MLLPNVTEILNDPEVGGGVSFQVIRTLNTRNKGSVTQTQAVYNLTGNIQPASKSIQTSTTEDLLNESITVWALFEFKTGTNNGATFTGPDEIIYNNAKYRVTAVDNWAEWGFTRATASKVMDSFEVETPQTEDTTGSTEPEPTENTVEG